MSDFIERYWRDATPADAIKEPPMVARFRDEHYKDWVVDKLIYWDRSETPWHRDDGHCYERCQVYDAPDLGEGWRLVDVESEKPQTGDEVWVEGGKWEPVQDSLHYSKRCAFRRRIEPPKPKYEPFRWEDREQLRGRWIRFTDAKHEMVCNQFIDPSDEPLSIFVNGYSAETLVERCVFLDTGEPVGRRVE